MSLCLWLPFNGNLENQGTVAMPSISISNSGWTTGKLCSKCVYIKGTPSNTITVPELNEKKEFSISVWWKLSENDMTTAKNHTDFFSVYVDTDGVESVYRIEHCDNAKQPGLAQSLFPRNINNFTPAHRGYGGHSGNKYQWNHEVVCVDESTAKWYLNGVCTYTVSVSEIYKDYMHLTGRLSIGGAGAFVQLQDFRIYDHCLSPKEVKELSKGLILHYPLNQPDKISNLLQRSYIVNRGCTNFVYDSDSNTYTCTVPPNSGVWGWGILFKTQANTIVLQPGETFIVSMEVKPDIDCTWNNDVNNYYSEATSGNDHDDLSKRRNSPRNLSAGLWNKIWFSYTAKSNVTYSIWDASSNWGIVTTNLSDSVNFQIRNIMGELTVVPSPIWIPAQGDADAWDRSVEYDCSGFGNNGTLAPSSCPSWSLDSIKYMGCYRFKPNQFIKSSSGRWKSGSFNDTTIAFWMCPNAITCGGAGGIMHDKNGAVGCFTMYHSQWQFTDGANWVNYNNGDNVVGVWGHYACTIKDGVVKVYKNGNLISTNTNSNILTSLTSEHFVALGCDFPGGDEYFNGKLSDFRIYATALSASDINDLYETKFSLDDKGAFYCGEFAEQDTSIQFSEKSILSVTEFCEFDSVNLSYTNTYEDNPTSNSYTPNTGDNSCLAAHKINQISLKVGDVVVLDLDVNWSGGFDESNMAGDFHIFFQGHSLKTNDSTRYWLENEYTAALNNFKQLRSLVLSSESGTYHYSVKVPVTSSMLQYASKYIGFRSNYSNGKGNIGIQHLFARRLNCSDDNTGKMKLSKNGILACEEIIES